MQKYNYDVLGIGNAVTDIFVEVEESFLKKNNLVEGTMKLVDEVFIKELLTDLNISKTYAGGSVANTLSTISKTFWILISPFSLSITTSILLSFPNLVRAAF